MKDNYFKQNGKFYYGWVNVLLAFLLMTFSYVSFLSLTTVFVIPVTTDLDISRSEFLLYSTILSISGIIALAVIGDRMAKGNIKRYMSAALALAGIAFLGFSQATEAWHFYMWSAAMGVSFVMTTVMPISVVLNLWFGGKIKGRAMGAAFTGSGFGGVMMIPIVNYIVTAFGWRIGYMVVAGIFLLLLLPLVAIFLKKFPEQKGFVRMGQKDDEKDFNSAGGMTLKEAWKNPMLYLILLSIISFVFCSTGILMNSTAFYIDTGFSPANAALFASFSVGALIIGKLSMGWISDKFGAKAGAISACLIFSGAFLSLALLPINPWIFIPFVILCYGIGGGGITVNPPLMTNRLFGEKDYGKIISVLTMGNNIGGAFGGTVAAWIFDVSGSYRAFWIIAATAMIVAAAARIAAFRIKKKYE